MFYKDMTFEKILDRALSRIDNSIDKRQGSIAYDATAASAAELALYYIELYQIDRARDPRNLFNEELDIYIESRSPITRRGATKAIRKGIFQDSKGNPFNIQLGSRFTAEDTYFKAIEKIENGVFKLECEEEGPIGNFYEGKILPVNNIPKLAKAEIIDILVPGYEEESDESFLARYLKFIREPIITGNKTHYEMWAKEVEGVGDAKVISLWKGDNTVLVVIVDSNMEPATDELVEKVQCYIDPIGEKVGENEWTTWGKGRGQAPLGAFCTVKSAEIKEISISLSITIKEGMSETTTKEKIRENIESYFKDLSLSGKFISYAKIGALIFAVDGVLDYSNLLVNGSNENIDLGELETPVLKEVVFNE